MNKEKINLKNELLNLKFDNNIIQKISCTKLECKKYQKLLKEGKPLPEGVYALEFENGEISTSEFYTIYDANLSSEEIKEYIAFKQLSYIKTIKNCVVFFTILGVFGLIGGIIALLTGI